MLCPNHCGHEVVKVFHEGLGKDIYLDPTKHKEHKCPEKRYWCFSCNAPIPEARPCIHRRSKVDSSNGLIFPQSQDNE